MQFLHSTFQILFTLQVVRKTLLGKHKHSFRSAGQLRNLLPLAILLYCLRTVLHGTTETVVYFLLCLCSPQCTGKVTGFFIFCYGLFLVWSTEHTIYCEGCDVCQTMKQPTSLC